MYLFNRRQPERLHILWCTMFNTFKSNAVYWSAGSHKRQLCSHNLLCPGPPRYDIQMK